MDALTLTLFLINNLLWMVFFIMMLPKRDIKERKIDAMPFMQPIVNTATGEVFKKHPDEIGDLSDVPLKDVVDSLQHKV